MTSLIKGRSARLLLGASVALALSAVTVSAQNLRFWTTEEQPERLAKQQELAAQFEKMTGASVEVIPVTESDLGTRTTAAFAAGQSAIFTARPSGKGLSPTFSAVAN